MNQEESSMNRTKTTALTIKIDEAILEAIRSRTEFTYRTIAKEVNYLLSKALEELKE
jgi:hypothetical protein